MTGTASPRRGPHQQPPGAGRPARRPTDAGEEGQRGVGSGVGAERPAVVSLRQRPASISRAADGCARPAWPGLEHRRGAGGWPPAEASRDTAPSRGCSVASQGHAQGRVQGPRARRLVLGVQQDPLPAPRPRPGERVASRGRARLRGRRSCVALPQPACCSLPTSNILTIK